MNHDTGSKIWIGSDIDLNKPGERTLYKEIIIAMLTDRNGPQIINYKY